MLQGGGRNQEPCWVAKRDLGREIELEKRKTAWGSLVLAMRRLPVTPVDQFGEEGANPKLQPREGLLNRTRRVGKEERVLNYLEACLRRRGRGLR